MLKFRSFSPKVTISTPGFANLRTLITASTDLYLQDENTRVVPPLGIFKPIHAAFDAVATTGAPTPFSHLWIVKSIKCLVYRFEGLNLWHNNREGPEIQYGYL